MSFYFRRKGSVCRLEMEAVTIKALALGAIWVIGKHLGWL